MKAKALFASCFLELFLKTIMCKHKVIVVFSEKKCYYYLNLVFLIVTPQTPGVPLTNSKPAKYLWVSHISIPHYCVSFNETHL